MYKVICKDITVSEVNSPIVKINTNGNFVYISNNEYSTIGVIIFCLTYRYAAPKVMKFGLKFRKTISNVELLCIIPN